MSDKIWFDPTYDKWALSDGEHYLEVPHWAREIIANGFERETRQLRELVDYMAPIAWYAASERERDRMRELGVEEQ